MEKSHVERAKEIYDRVMSVEQVDHTNAWWASLVQDKARLVAWLQKLHNSEIHGYTEYRGFIKRYQPELVTATVLRAMAQDEQRHATIIDQCLAYMNESLVHGVTQSQYWLEMQRHAHDFKSACAVKFYGETLASQRFKLLRDHPDTPDDLFHAFRWITPDEERHCQTMFLFAGAEAIVNMEQMHLNAVANLVKKKY
jgi:rubrerythrin